MRGRAHFTRDGDLGLGFPCVRIENAHGGRQWHDDPAGEDLRAADRTGREFRLPPEIAASQVDRAQHVVARGEIDLTLVARSLASHVAAHAPTPALTAGRQVQAEHRIAGGTHDQLAVGGFQPRDAARQRARPRVGAGRQLDGEQSPAFEADVHAIQTRGRRQDEGGPQRRAPHQVAVAGPQGHEVAGLIREEEPVGVPGDGDETSRHRSAPARHTSISGQGLDHAVAGHKHESTANRGRKRRGEIAPPTHLSAIQIDSHERAAA